MAREGDAKQQLESPLWGGDSDTLASKGRQKGPLIPSR